MRRIPGVNHLDAVRALEKAGFCVVRQGKHIVMSDGVRQVTIPRHNPVKAFTMGGIVQDAGLTVEEFRELLQNFAEPAHAADRGGGSEVSRSGNPGAGHASQWAGGGCCMIDDRLGVESSRYGRRWLAFGIWALLIAVTIAGVSWPGWGMPRARNQPGTREATRSPQMPTALATARREAMDAIQRLEVTVSFDEQKRVTAIEFRDSVGVWDDGRTDYRLTDTDLEHLKWFPEVQVVSIPGWPTSDRGVQHLRGLRELRKLDLCGAKITDAGLEHLADMTQLEELNLMWAPISGSGFQHLKRLTGLRVLVLSFSTVTDRGLEHLQAFKRLEHVSLDATPVTDAGLVHLRGLNRLQSLDLGNNADITDAGLEHLKSLTGLRVLDLSFTSVTDRGLEHLQAFTRLEHLSLNVTPVTDAGLVHLRGLNRLQSLDLGNNADITDAGLEHLKSLGQLRGLVLQRTAVTDAGLEELRQALPDCRIAK